GARMNKKMGIKIVCICVLGGALYSLWGKDVLIKSREKLFKSVGKTALAVVLFYHEDKEQSKDRVYKSEVRQQEQVLKDVSSMPLYREADILFARVNSAVGKTEGLAQEYGITTGPAAVLFIDGAPLDDTRGAIVGLYGSSAITRADLKKIIDAYFMQDIQRILQGKALIRQRQIEEAQLNALYWALIGVLMVRMGGGQEIMGMATQRVWVLDFQSAFSFCARSKD
ncbi:hypothetical protein, partial [Methylicorpusculum sp.]|uniref:hypothetical protein n=1 Tax=Methylicorpusculum sp. TaxID=2713644 RepID=UPI002ABA859C